MNTIFNFGDPHKDFTDVASQTLGEFYVRTLPITSSHVFCDDRLQIVDACYGFAQTWDTLTMMKKAQMLEKGDNIVFLGSMGSLSSQITLDDFVIPSQVHYIGLDKKDDIVMPDQVLLAELKGALRRKNIMFLAYEHGSVRAVFDPTTDHTKYRNRLFDENVLGLDCSESYAGLKFCEKNSLHGVVLLYCSDDPSNKIADISQDEFNARAQKRDFELHQIAESVFMKIVERFLMRE